MTFTVMFYFEFRQLNVRQWARKYVWMAHVRPPFRLFHLHLEIPHNMRHTYSCLRCRCKMVDKSIGQTCIHRHCGKKTD